MKRCVLCRVKALKSHDYIRLKTELTRPGEPQQPGRLGLEAGPDGAERKVAGFPHAHGRDPQRHIRVGHHEGIASQVKKRLPSFDSVQSRTSLRIWKCC